jgi:hypothetical protein
LCGRQRTMGELIHHNQPQSGPPSYIPGHLSMSSAPNYPPKIPQFDFNGAAPRRYSEQPGFSDRSAAETESYRSRSPPFEETRERDMMIPSIYVAGSPGNMSPERAQSPPINRRPVPESPLRPSPISPLAETMYVPLHMDTERTSPGHPPANLQPNPR